MRHARTVLPVSFSPASEAGRSQRAPAAAMDTDASAINPRNRGLSYEREWHAYNQSSQRRFRQPRPLVADPGQRRFDSASSSPFSATEAAPRGSLFQPMQLSSFPNRQSRALRQQPGRSTDLGGVYASCVVCKRHEISQRAMLAARLPAKSAARRLRKVEAVELGCGSIFPVRNPRPTD